VWHVSIASAVGHSMSGAGWLAAEVVLKLAYGLARYHAAYR
jgi:hypothetical protein